MHVETAAKIFAFVAVTGKALGLKDPQDPLREQPLRPQFDLLGTRGRADQKEPCDTRENPASAEAR
jgi:hypothetical protein